MGEPKMLMKWGLGTVLGRVISRFAEVGVEDILVITGSNRESIEKLVREQASRHPVRCVFNAEYETGEMLSSIQCGLKLLTESDAAAAMIGLGDQPQVEERTVKLILESYELTSHPLIVPSHQMRRGHPWLVGRPFWTEILQMRSPETLRDFLRRHAADIHYVKAGSASILADLDTPADYARARSAAEARESR
jgi:molybdenum cofactor cytidylyltransferase